MSLHPIRSGRNTRRRKAAWRSFRTTQQWKPWKGWDPNPKKIGKSILSLFGRKSFVILLVILAATTGFGAMYADANNPLFHHYIAGLYDPTTLLWHSTGASGNNAEFNTAGNNAVFGTTAFNNCSGCKDIALTSSATISTEALTNASINTLSQSASKNLLLSFNFYLNGNPTANIPFYYFLTLNKTISSNQLTYNPLNDPSVIFAIQFSCVSSCSSGTRIYSMVTYLQLKPGDSINSEIPTGVCTSTNSCFQSQQLNSGLGTVDPLSHVVLLQQYLNYTGGTTQNNPCPATTASFGGGCSTQFAADDETNFYYATGRLLQPTLLSQPNYYFGIFTSPNFGSQLVTLYDVGTYGSGAAVNLDRASGSFGAFCPCGVRSMESDLVVLIAANATPPAPTIDTGGFFGPIIKALINLGVFIINSILGFVAFIVPALESALNFLESIIVIALNGVGNVLGWGNIGTDLQTLLNALITFLTDPTNGLPFWILQVPAYMSRFFNWITLGATWVPVALTLSSNVISVALAGFAQAIAIWQIANQFVAASISFLVIFSFFIYTGDDAITGMIDWAGTIERVMFSLINIIFDVVNVALEFIILVISLIPKPFIQSSAGKVPRLPSLDVGGGGIAFPRFDFGEALSGNLITYWLWMLGLYMSTWYESRNPALVGSLGAIVPSAASNMQLLANLVPLFQVFVFISGGLCLFWIVNRPLSVIGLPEFLEDAGLGVGPGRPIRSGPGGIKVRAGVKHYGPAFLGTKARIERASGGPVLLGPRENVSVEEQATA